MILCRLGSGGEARCGCGAAVDVGAPAARNTAERGKKSPLGLGLCWLGVGVYLEDSNYNIQRKAESRSANEIMRNSSDG